MSDGIRWVGLDVHARESTFAVFDQGMGEVITRRVAGRPHELLPWLRSVQRPARMVCEAGLTGYGLARRALAEGIELGVCAPGKTERPFQDRVTTDKRDPVRLARCHQPLPLDNRSSMWANSGSPDGVVSRGGSRTVSPHG
jgi:transposase